MSIYHNKKFQECTIFYIYNYKYSHFKNFFSSNHNEFSIVDNSISCLEKFLEMLPGKFNKLVRSFSDDTSN